MQNTLILRSVKIEYINIQKLHITWLWGVFMFKVEKPEMINKTFRLPLKLVQELQMVAQNKEVSLNNLVQQCCEYALKHLDKS